MGIGGIGRDVTMEKVKYGIIWGLDLPRNLFSLQQRKQQNLKQLSKFDYKWLSDMQTRR